MGEDKKNKKSDEEIKAELDALAQAEEEKAKADAAEKEKGNKKDFKEAVVLDKNGKYVRTYTPDMSDDDKDYLEKAKGYAKKIGGTVK